MMKNIVCSAALLAATSGMSMAADFSAEFEAVYGGGSIKVGSSTYSAGHMEFKYGAGGSPVGQASGQFVGNQNDTFRTFCVELQNVNYNQIGFDIVPVSVAPDANGNNPNGNQPYGAILAAAVHDVVWKAIDLDWINEDLSVENATLPQLTAIQGAIWYALFNNAAAVNANGNVIIQGMMDTLTGEIGNNRVVSGLRAMTSRNGQDQLYVVPLPPAAFAGLATLVGIAGVSRIRRR